VCSKKVIEIQDSAEAVARGLLSWQSMVPRPQEQSWQPAFVETATDVNGMLR
jgi:hypothetical protein